jgi:hypothetical protein
MNEQLRMFMTPREIMSKYQPLDGDRYTPEQAKRSENYPTKDIATQPPIKNRSSLKTHRARMRAGELEGDAELWQRKAAEGHRYEIGPVVKGEFTTLPESIAREGVKNPVHLSSDQFGAMGKRVVAGGHHRIAAAHEVAPDKLIPVLHHRDVNQAFNAKHGYRYT